MDKVKGDTEEAVLFGVLGVIYHLPATAFRITDKKNTPQDITVELAVQLGSSESRGRERYAKHDLRETLAEIPDELDLGKSPDDVSLSEFKQYVHKQYGFPVDGLSIDRIGNAFTLTANADSLLFFGKRTFYVRRET